MRPRTERSEGGTQAHVSESSPVTPMSNRGVYPLSDEGINPVGVDGFDGYCATIYTTAIDALFDDLFVLFDSAGLDPVALDGPKPKYYSAMKILNDQKGHQMLALKWGGSNPHPHVECKGLPSRVLAEYLREHYDHRPTRIDYAVDRRGPDLFDRLHAYAKDLCMKYGLRGAPDGDWVTKDAGRTWYIGNRSSQVFMRIYEKGLEYAKKLGLPVTDELREWVRIEIEFKPQTKVAKKLAPSIDGPQLWGSTQWTSQIAKELLSMPTEPVCIRERRESNRERALRFMGSQYGAHLRSLFNDCDGDLAEFGRAIAELAGVEEKRTAA